MFKGTQPDLALVLAARFARKIAATGWTGPIPNSQFRPGDL